MNISELVKLQREYFATGETLSVKWRCDQLKRLYAAIKKRERDILSALKSDLGKSDYEGYMCEVGMTLSEIGYMLKHVKGYAKKQRVRTPLAQFPSHSYTLATPYGNTLIMSPWNYPFLLTMEPLADAIAAGNTAIVKPSAYSPATAQIVADIIGECFEPRYIATVLGGREENQELLNQRFDFVFFTGSVNIGKEVLRHTAETLTPVVLELGGKSPCIVDATADIKLSAKRIVFGKYLNCGQTCVAPDYVLCHERVKDEFIREVQAQIEAQYGDLTHYGRIVNEKHFDRLLSLIDKDKVVYGGNSDRGTLRIEPTVMDGVTLQDAVMGEEIFGPIMPIITFKDYTEVYDIIGSGGKPLALYIFSRDKEKIEDITGRIPFGGGCVNDTIIHLATCEMGFGGVGESGMGSYHGKAGFEAFSHRKSIVNKGLWFDLPMRYRPYGKPFYEKLLRFFLR